MAATLDAPATGGTNARAGFDRGSPVRRWRCWWRCLPSLRRASSRGTPALTDRDTIILADFVNTTDEPVFDGALKVALAVALEQSPFLKVFPDDSVRDTLRLMQRSPDERAHATARARRRAARAAQGAGRRIDRETRQPLRARARGGQRRERRRDGARTGRSRPAAKRC